MQQIYGAKSDSVYIFIHGKNGNKEEGEDFANCICNKGYQVLSIDLPGHGERKGENNTFNPWHVIPELKEVMKYAKENWSKIGLRANSIGAWFSMISFQGEHLIKSLFVSPIVDMEKLILDMMKWANVSEEKLEKEQEIETSFGETLSWKYYNFAIEHRIEKWDIPTVVLYGDKVNLTNKATIESFVKKFNCNIKVMEHGEHWFHTSEQMEVLRKWTIDEIN